MRLCPIYVDTTSEKSDEWAMCGEELAREKNFCQEHQRQLNEGEIFIAPTRIFGRDANITIEGA